MNDSPYETSTEPEIKKGPGTRKQLSRIFWLSFLILSLVYAWYCFYAPSNSVSWAPDYTEAQELAVQSDKPMILFFTATWCVPCRIMKRTVWADEEVATKVNKRFIPLMLYADDPDMAEVFSRYQVDATPTTIITDPQGSVIDWIHGKVEKKDFIEWFENLSHPTQ